MEVASWGYGQLVRLLQSNDEDGKMRSQSKVESKYNVVTEYRNLNLHQAAFTNDVGSAAFALRNGQPYNSVYKGTLPIHAASLAGSRDVLKMLIDAGADVNAARLPKHIGAPKESHIHHHHHHNPPGTTGSTPLHFAAAGGHIQIVSILLSHGADSNKCDKNGQVPATLALHCGFKDIVHLLVNHTMNTSQSPDEAIDALEDKIVREEQSKHRRPSLPSIIEQSSSTIKNSTNSIRRGSRTRRYSHSENLANVLETPSSPLPNAPPTPIEESFNLNRAGETFSSENVNEVAAVNHDSSSNQQHPQHSLRRLVSKQSLASLFSRSRSDAARTQEALSDGGDIEDDSRPRSNSNSSLSPTVEHISAPSSPLKKGNKLPKRRSASSTKANKEETISAVIQDDQPSSSGLPMTLTPLQPPRNRTNTVSTMSSTNTRSSNTRTTATDDSSNTSPTHSGSFVFNVPMNQSQHAREAHADRQQKRRAQVRQQSSTSVLSNATSGSTSVGVGGQQTSPNKAQRPKLVGGPSQRTHSHAQSHAQSHSHSHSHSRFNNLQELPLAEQEERLSSAQAAEMVKKVERELLTLAESGKAPNAIDGRRGSDGSGGSGTSGVSGGSVTSSGGGSIGRGVEQHDLLERLQRYGETLALEREARKREDELAGGSANGSVNGSASVPHASPASVSQPPPSHDELRASVTYGEQPTPTTSSSTPPHSPRTFTRRQSSLQHNKLRQSHNTAKKNQYSVKADLFQNDFDSKIPSPLHLSHTTTNSSTRYSKIFKGIRSKLTH